MFQDKLINSHPYIKYIIVTAVFFLVLLIDLQFIIFTSRTINLLIRVVYFGIMALGFNMLLGYAGQISLGHAAYMGLGAYLTAYFSNHMGWNFMIILLLSGLIPMALGIILGLVALRMERLYLAIATLGLGVTGQMIFQEWRAFTRGFSGIRLERPEILGFAFNNSRHFLMLITVILLLVIILTYNFSRSRTGRALSAMRDSEYASQSLGISLFKYKLLAFAASSFYVGIAGSLYAYAERYVHPSTWGVELSLDMLAMVVIGGLASIGGSLVGAGFLVLVPRLTAATPVLADITNMNYILTGLAMILVIKYMPYGIYTTIDLKLIQPYLMGRSGENFRYQDLKKESDS